MNPDPSDPAEHRFQTYSTRRAQQRVIVGLIFAAVAMLVAFLLGL